VKKAQNVDKKQQNAKLRHILHVQQVEVAGSQSIFEGNACFFPHFR